MSTAIAVPRNTAATFLTHFFGSGLADDRYVVERFKALATGDIRPCSAERPAPAAKGKRGAKRAAANRARDARLRAAGIPRRDMEKARAYERERSRR